ncbi:hypothetical protein AYI68_g2777 [Smittium mucronatum]|uniref:Uncharacterized protein n=1 Tax=Smittium mucronatum TaxID=133383 RepID=A0A1R0H1S8_9FUNG|nr:hypothetical protein AYI68_g2777 [Smittium mucronatum]
MAKTGNHCAHYYVNAAEKDVEFAKQFFVLVERVESSNPCHSADTKNVTIVAIRLVFFPAGIIRKYTYCLSHTDVPIFQ